MNESAVSPKRARYLRELRRQNRRVRLWQLAILAGFFAFWELSCRIGLSDGFLVSSPSRIAATFLSLCRSGDVLVHVGVSCWETVVGFLLGYFLTEGLLTEGWRYGAAIAAAAVFFLPSVCYDRYAGKKGSLTYTILRLF